jgi:hypothetical protein
MVDNIVRKLYETYKHSFNYTIKTFFKDKFDSNQFELRFIIEKLKVYFGTIKSSCQA